jgi:pimeloyl-ACP methyl ester carboxylesterase
MKVSEGRARTRDGTPIGYTLHGDPTASRFAVLVHSLAMDRHFWDPVARRLPSDAAVLTYDCRGHGASGAGAADLRPVLAAIRAPTAIVAGKQDYATPVGMAEALHSNIEGSTLTVLKNARHLTPLEKPDEIAAELEKLLK